MIQSGPKREKKIAGYRFVDAATSRNRRHTTRWFKRLESANTLLERFVNTHVYTICVYIYICTGVFTNEQRRVRYNVRFLPSTHLYTVSLSSHELFAEWKYCPCKQVTTLCRARSSLRYNKSLPPRRLAPWNASTRKRERERERQRERELFVSVSTNP